MNKILLSITLLLIFEISALAQCPISATATVDLTTICSPGGTVILSGSSSATPIYDDFWSSNTDNPNSANTTATVTAPTTFTYTAQYCDNLNLIANGDFESGDADFFSDFAAAAGVIAFPGEYSVVVTPPIILGLAISCADLTPGPGDQMLLVNALNISNQNGWCQDVTINPNSDYKFAFNAAGIISGTTLEATIDGALIGITSVPSPNSNICQWTNFSTVLINPCTSSTPCTMEICIENTTSGPGGIIPPTLPFPVYSLDEISLNEICTDSDDVFVDVITVEAKITPPNPSIDCNGNNITLDGSSSSAGPNITYQWTTSGGNIVGSTSNITAEIDQAGDYTLTATFDDGSTVCSDLETVTVSDGSVEANILTPPFIDCDANTETIDGSTSTTGANIIYQWTTPDGNIVGSTTNSTVDVNLAGSYTLTVTYDDGTIICTDSETIVVDQAIADAAVFWPPPLGCGGGTVIIDGTLSSSGPFTTYQWTTPDGNIIGPSTNTTVQVDMAGTYTLTVTYDDGIFICTDAVTVSVAGATAVAIIASPPIIGCLGTSINIDGSGSSAGSFITYQWTTTDGNIISATSSNNIDVDMGGSYTLTVTYDDGATVCSESETVTVLETTAEAIILLPSPIDCNGTPITIDGSLSSSGPFITYQWITPDGNIIGSSTTSTVDVDMAGNYTLTVNYDDGTTICTDTESVSVTESNVEARIAIPQAIDCDGNQITIDGSLSSFGVNIFYTWSTPDGNIIGSTSGNSIAVDQGGEYILTVTYDDGTTICSDTESVVVDEIDIKAIITVPDLIDCDNNPIVLDGSNSSSGPNISYAWTTPDGNIIGSFLGNSVSVDKAGSYTLTLTYDDGTTVCSVSEMVNVIEIEVEAIIVTPEVIDCDDNQIIIDGSNSTADPNITYSWTTTNGNIIGSTTGNTIDVDKEGEYLLTVIYDDGNIICTDVVSVFVTEIEINVIIDTPPDIDCNGTPVELNGTNSTSGVDIVYSWTTSNGNIIGSTTGNTIDVDREGEYFLTVTYNDGVTTCAKTESVNVNQLMIIVEVETPDLIDCDNNPITLDAANSSIGPNISYEWSTTNGNLIGSPTGNMVGVDKEGDYTFTLTYDDGSVICKEFETVTVQEIEVKAIIDTPPFIDCDNTSVTLDGFGSSTGAGYTYEWTTIDGNIVGSNSGIEVEVNESGDYTLTVRYNANGIFCEISETVTIEEIEIEAAIVPPPLIDCDGNSIFIDGDGSSTGVGYFYEWTTINGNILGSNSDIEVRVNEPGDYTLTVTYDDNGVYCEESVSVIVEQVQINVQIETPDPLDCQNTPIIIDGSNSSIEPEYSYEWTTSAGNIIGPTDQTTIEVNVAADYFLTVTYDANGIFCSKTEGINVQNSTVSAVIADPDLIDCDGSSIILDGSGSSQGPGIVLKWTTIDGNIIGPDFLRTIEVDEPGEYILEVSFNDNGVICLQSTSVIVEKIEVEIDIVSPPAIDCFGNSVFIDGSNSSTGSDYFYQWTTPDGNIVGVNDEFIVEVDKEGDYTLTITYDDGVNFCTDLETVSVDKIEVEVLIETPELIDCDGNPVSLNGSNSSSGVGYFYEWTTTNGNILNAFNTAEIEVNRAGEYILTVTYNLNGVTCSKMEAIEVFNDPDRPTASILPPLELSCKDSILTINGSQSSQGSNITFNWSSIDGNIINGLSADSAIINKIGTYQLLVTDTDNACKDSVEVIVIGNYDQPIISFLQPDTLSCRDTLISISASNSGSSTDYKFNWNALSGNITSSSNLSIIEVNQAGLYELMLTKNSNGCKDTAEVEVVVDILSPTVGVFLPDDINCENDSIQLDGTRSDMGPEFLVGWETNDGNFLSNKNTPTPFVDKSGTYWFTVENIKNGCSDSLSVFVGMDTIAPIVDGGPPLTFGCNSDSVQLMPLISGNTSAFSYQWGAVSGNILSNSFTLNPFVGSAGTYMIFVSDTSNKCMSVDTTMVLPDIDLPNVSIIAFDTLGCSVDSIQLDASNSDIGTNFNFSWSTIDGNFNSNPIDYQPFVSEPGTYELVVKNTDNGCENLATISIIENIDTPQIFIADPEIINCDRSKVEIIGFVSSQTGNISFEWSTTNGSISGAIDRSTIEVISGGTYFLKVTDLNRGCESVKVVQVEENINTPDFLIGLPDTINCKNSSVNLQPSFLNPSTDYIYEWTSTNGGFLGAINEGNAIADLIGNYTLLVIDTVSKCQHFETIEVLDNFDYPMVTIETQDSLDCGETRIIDASNSSQGNNFIYRWTTPNGVLTMGNGTLMPTISSEGKYILEIENSINGCISVDSVEVFGENSISNIEIMLNGIDTLNCLNSSITATTNQGNYSYRWVNATNPNSGIWTNEALIEMPGIVQVILRDLDTGCEGSTTIEVFGDFEKPMVTPQLPDSITCQDTLVELAIQLTGDINDYSFLWTTANGNFSQNSNQNIAEVSSTGIYFIETTSLSNGCIDTSMVEVFESKDVPQIEESISNQINCKYDSAVISAIISNITADPDIIWTTVDGSLLSVTDPEIVTIGSGGTYKIEVVDFNSGCKTEKEILIIENFEQPIINPITTDTLTCTNLEVEINVNVTNIVSTEFEWTTTNGNILGAINDATIIVDERGVYKYKIVNPESFCELVGDIEVYQDITPPEIVIDTPESLTCKTNQIQIDARQSSNGGFLSNRWTTDSNGNIVSGANGLGPIVDEPAIYYLEITNIFNGCNAVDSIRVDSLVDDLNSLMISQIPPSCENEVGTIQIEDILGSFPPFEYSIDGGLTYVDDVLFENLPEGNYDIIVRDSIGCTEFQIVEFIVPTPIEITLIPEITLSAGATRQLEVSLDVPLDQIATIQWIPATNLSCSNCLNPIVTGTNNTSYLVRVTTIDDCASEATIQIKIDGQSAQNEEGFIYFPSAFSPNDDGINDLFTGFSNSGKVANIETLQVFDRWGNKMYGGNNGSPNSVDFGWDGRYKNKRMNTGVYVFYAKVKLITGETILVEGDITLAL